MDIRRPAEVVQNAVAATAVPVDCWIGQAREQIRIRVVRLIRIDLGNQHGSDDRATAAAAEIQNAIANDEDRTVPHEITVHLEAACYRENAVTIGGAAEGDISIDVIDCRSANGTHLNGGAA